MKTSAHVSIELANGYVTTHLGELCIGDFPMSDLSIEHRELLQDFLAEDITQKVFEDRLAQASEKPPSRGIFKDCDDIIATLDCAVKELKRLNDKPLRCES